MNGTCLCQVGDSQNMRVCNKAVGSMDVLDKRSKSICRRHRTGQHNNDLGNNETNLAIISFLQYV